MTRTLSDLDIQMLTEALKPHYQCNMGLTQAEVAEFRRSLSPEERSKALNPEEIGMLKRLVSAFDTTASVIGKVVLTAVTVITIGIFTKGFWLSLASGIKVSMGGK